MESIYRVNIYSTKSTKSHGQDTLRPLLAIEHSQELNVRKKEDEYFLFNISIPLNPDIYIRTLLLI